MTVVVALVVGLVVAALVAGAVWQRRDRRRMTDLLRTMDGHKPGLAPHPRAGGGRAGAGPDEAVVTPVDLENLWAETQRRLSKYHQIAVLQGRESFRMLLLFSSLGFGLLAAIVWRASEVDTPTGGVALSAAGVAGSALTAYIGRTFIRAYHEANARLTEYFAEPLHMSRYLAAERLLPHLSERDAGAMLILQAVLARTAPVGPPSSKAARSTPPGPPGPPAPGPTPPVAVADGVAHPGANLVR